MQLHIQQPTNDILHVKQPIIKSFTTYQTKRVPELPVLELEAAKRDFGEDVLLSAVMVMLGADPRTIPIGSDRDRVATDAAASFFSASTPLPETLSSHHHVNPTSYIP